jgi:hypothetical protein
MANSPPTDVTFAAAVVQSWLDQQNPAQGKVSDEVYRAMTPAQRLDYARQFDQKQFQNNKDGRR